VLIVAALPIYVSQREIYGKNSSDWVSVAAYLRSHARAGDAVYFAPRYDVPGATVGQTTRGILTAYPDDFAGLADVTLQQSAAAAGNLTGVSRRLAASDSQLASSAVVWVIRRVDYPQAEAAADAAVLAGAGLEPAPQGWVGPLDQVLQYRRTS
jgi:mannosyltransferase